MRRPRLVVMLKEPRAGRVKTRLGRDIGMTAAAWWFRHQSASILRRLDDPRWHLVIAASPDSAASTCRIWPAHLPRMAQGGGDLGQRMAGIIHRLRPDPVVIIGGDIPGITPFHIAQAFGALGSAPLTFGPADDGGYWLIGFSGPRPPPAGFLSGVRWSTRHALADSIATAPDLRHRLVATLGDVDTAADLAVLPRHFP